MIRYNYGHIIPRQHGIQTVIVGCQYDLSVLCGAYEDSGWYSNGKDTFEVALKTKSGELVDPMVVWGWVSEVSLQMMVDAVESSLPCGILMRLMAQLQ
jgi:hypothetical protein